MKRDFLNRLFNLDKKVVIVTGATGRLGRKICKAYSELGSKVIGTDKKLDRKGTHKARNVRYLDMDVTDKRVVSDVFRYIYSEYGKADILINNAGVSTFEPFCERTEESFDWVMDVNLKGTFFAIREYARQAKRRKHGGNIVNIGSIYGVVSPDPRIYTDCKRMNSEVYGATKAGIIQMTRYFAVHLAEQRIRTNCVSPGGIFNPGSPQGKDFVKNYSSRCPLGRMAVADEIIGAILYLSSDASTYTTGQNIVVDGGMSSW